MQVATPYTNAVVLPLQNGHKVLLGKQFNKLKNNDLFSLINKDISSIKDLLRRKKRLSFDYDLSVERDDKGKMFVIVRITRFKGIKGKRYPIFQSRYIQRWREESKPISFFTQDFLTRNKERVFSNEYLKLEAILIENINKYNCFKLSSEGQEYFKSFDLNVDLGETLKSDEIRKFSKLKLVEEK